MNVRYRFLWLFLAAAAVLVIAEERVHIVQKGETIYSVARSYGVNFQEVLDLNGIDDPRKIQVGQRIKIPGTVSPSGPSAGAFIEHRVSRGETLYGIARSYEITLQALQNANNLPAAYVLKVGDTLRIPQAASAVGTVPPAASPAEGGTSMAGGEPAEARSTVARAVDASVRWPVNAKAISYMTGKLSGVVLMGERSEPVKSLTQGTVVSAGPYRGFGRVAIIQVTGGYLYVYGGCESLSVKEGDRVVPGTELGRLGIDGVSEKPQLFFLVYRNNSPIDPAKAPRA
ncbi:MAG: M23 family metallopeptidase [Treponema sp.]|jgi:murein DD-endopeptidase MepM/ murein hydrolase activator NlpD|nr:M23 family metallopeptidase [Treponema sp.]